MKYRQLRASYPPPVFELRVKTALAQLVLGTPVPLPRSLMVRMREYIESMLLAENLPPIPCHIAMLLDSFAKLAHLSEEGKPFLYKKRHTVSLLFNVWALQSEMAIDAPDDLVLGYTQSMMGFLLFKSAPETIGMIGLGGGSLAKFCYRYLPGASISVAEIDPRVIALRDHFHIPKDDARLQVQCIDGAAFVQQAVDAFDVLMVDGFDVHGQPPQLCTQRFYNGCYRALKPGGVMVINLLGDVAENRIYLERLRTAFNGKVLMIEALDSLNKIAFASKGDSLDLGEYSLRRRIRLLESRHPLFLGLTAQSILLARRQYSSAPGCQ